MPPRPLKTCASTYGDPTHLPPPPPPPKKILDPGYGPVLKLNAHKSSYESRDGSEKYILNDKREGLRKSSSYRSYSQFLPRKTGHLIASLIRGIIIHCNHHLVFSLAKSLRLILCNRATYRLFTNLLAD